MPYRGTGKQYVTGQEHEQGRVRLEQNDCLQGEKEIPKENSDLSYLRNIHKVRLFTKYESHMIVPSHMDPPYSIVSDSSTSCLVWRRALCTSCFVGRGLFL